VAGCVTVALMRSLLVLSIALGAAAFAAACFSPTEQRISEAVEHELVQLELTCEAGALTFDVRPAPPSGASLIGKLGGAGEESTLFDCHPLDEELTGDDGGGEPLVEDAIEEEDPFPSDTENDAGPQVVEGKVILLCKERPQSVHAGRWDIAISRTGAVFSARLDKGDDAGDAVAMACHVPTKVDAGTDASEPDASEANADAGPSTPSVATYAEVAPILASACGNCHAGEYDTLALVKTNKGAMHARIASGSMPRGRPAWKDSTAGLTVLDFLANSPELE
jgi:hypothetical protein